MKYKEFQVSWPLIILMAPVIALLVVLYLYQWGTNPLPLSALVVLLSLFLVILLLFYGMTTTISEQDVTIKFGIGIIRKTISLRGIEAVSLVNTPFYYGWGIRFIPNGMLYNAYGSGAVELKLADSARRILIGTQHAHQLAKIINTIGKGVV